MTRTSRYLPIVILTAVVAALLLLPAGDPKTQTLIEAALLVGFTIACWAFGWLAEPATTLAFFLLVVLFHVARPEVVFSGFASSAWWLVLGGSITAIAVHTTGLGRRLAALLLGRATGSYPRAVATVAVAAVGLAFLMPSTSGRILLLMPIVLGFAERLGLARGRPGYVGLVLTVATASYMPPTTILPANVPNGIPLGAAEQLYGIRLAYGPYRLLHFPILGALKTVALIWLVCRLFPEREALRPAPPEEIGPMSPRERRLAWLLALSLIMFATDFIHGISPAWVSLGTGVICLMPPLGLVTPADFSARINVVLLIYVAGILGLGAVVAGSGLSAAVSERLLAWARLVPGHDAYNVGMLSAIGAGLAALTTVTGAPAVLTPLAREFAEATGLPLLTILMLQVVPFSTVFLPFESPPIMVAMQIGDVGVRPASKLCLALAATTILILLPLDYLWWRLLGYLP